MNKFKVPFEVVVLIVKFIQAHPEVAKDLIELVKDITELFKSEA